MSLDPKVRAVGLHLGTASAATLATALWLASHNVDLYAIVDQVNVVIKEVTKLLASLSVFAGGAWQVWKATQKEAAKDVAATGAVVITTPAIAAATPEAPNIVSTMEAAAAVVAAPPVVVVPAPVVQK